MYKNGNIYCDISGQDVGNYWKATESTQGRRNMGGWGGGIIFTNDRVDEVRNPQNKAKIGQTKLPKPS